MGHRHARLSVFARKLIVERHQGGWSAARVAEQLGVSRESVYKWLRRYAHEGEAGLQDRSSRPNTTPTRSSTEVENEVLELRRRERRGPVFLAGELGPVASTVGGSAPDVGAGRGAPAPAPAALSLQGRWHVPHQQQRLPRRDRPEQAGAARPGQLTRPLLYRSASAAPGNGWYRQSVARSPSSRGGVRCDVVCG